MGPDGKKPLAEWAHWRGPIDVNRFIKEGLATEWEGKLWCGSEADRKTLDSIIEADKRKPKPAPPQ
mgnify:FL=1